jgi:hypothetical protein
MFSDGSPTSSTVIRRFYVGAQGGSIFYSDAARTIGVSLSPGANAWAVVSDRNLKENLVELNHLQTLSKIRSLKTYRYNFIDRPEKEYYYGTTAQEWREVFGSFPEEKLYSEKDPLKIDQGDMMGVILSGIKGLLSQIQNLEERKLYLQKRRRV